MTLHRFRISRRSVRWFAPPVVLALLAGAVAMAVSLAGPAAAEDLDGVDVSQYQGSIDWGPVAAAGERFAIARATTGLPHVDPTFNANYDGAKAAGLFVGAYHFARPEKSSGREQANFFLDHARFVADGRTLPPTVDMENCDVRICGDVGYCYGHSPGQMVAWIREFVDTVKARTGRDAIIYTRTNWWNDCTGADGSFGANPLWISRYGTSSPGALPASWSTWTLWQYTSSGSVPGVPARVDRNLVAGGAATLQALAGGGGPGVAPADVFAVSVSGGSGTSEAHVLGRVADYRAFVLQTPTGMHPTHPRTFSWEVGDFNRDAVNDLYVIAHVGGSGSTEVHVLNGADGYQTFLAHAATPLHHTAIADWQFGVGDFNGDGADDVYALSVRGAGTTEVHILDAADHFQTWLWHSGSALHHTDVVGWQFGVGDFDGDRRADVYAVSHDNGRGNTETHILSAASGFGAFALQVINPLHPINRDSFKAEVGDVDGDRRDDLYLISYSGATNSTEIHILSAASDLQAWVLHTGTSLHPTNQTQWYFAV